MKKGMIIEISSEPKIGKDIETFQARIHRKIISVAPDVKNETYRFAYIAYRFKWTAEEFDINRVDTLRSQIKRLCEEFIEKWKYSIEINFIEIEKE